MERYTYGLAGEPRIFGSTGPGPERLESAIANRFMFTGREFIRELGIYDYRNRFYHPGIGRFLQTDPTGFDAGDMNLFRYCGDDPVNKTDPDGLVARISPDRFWEGAKHWDSSNTLQGTFADRMSGLQAGPDGAGGGNTDRVVLGGNALKPTDDPSHYTSEKLKHDGKPAAGLTTQELVPNDNGTVTLKVDWRVRDYLAARDKTLAPTEKQHSDRWQLWIKRMNKSDSDLSKKFNGAPWNRGTAEAIRNFLDPGRYSNKSYYRNEIIQQRLDFDVKGRPHEVLARSYGLTD